MAHFAELDASNIVLRVLVVSNNDITDDSGQEQEQLGISFLQELFGADTRWVQTSYNGNFRHKYAGIGDTYDEQREAFIAPRPYPSWTLNEETLNWEAPVPMPNDGQAYLWDEAQQSWVTAPSPAPQ